MILISNYEKLSYTGFRGTSENAKTKLCMGWANGECRFGEKCNFAHGEHELRRLSSSPERQCLVNTTNVSGKKHEGIEFLKNEGERFMTKNLFVPVHGPNGWTEYHDSVSGNKYYHNHNTNKTQWEQPIEWNVFGE